MAAIAPTQVDVVLGYTPGYVTFIGGASQAVTRLNHLSTSPTRPTSTAASTARCDW
jgi:hypothetical protein